MTISGTMTSSAVTPSFCASRPVMSNCETTVSACTMKSMRANICVRCSRILEHVLHQAQLLEVQDGVRRGDA